MIKYFNYSKKNENKISDLELQLSHHLKKP